MERQYEYLKTLLAIRQHHSKAETQWVRRSLVLTGDNAGRQWYCGESLRWTTGGDATRITTTAWTQLTLDTFASLLSWSWLLGTVAAFAEHDQYRCVKLEWEPRQCCQTAVWPRASFFFGAYSWLVKVLGQFSIIYFRVLGLRIGVRVWVRVRVGVRVWVRVRVGVRVWVRVRVEVRVRVSVVLWSG